jgi:hypothetical protein
MRSRFDVSCVFRTAATWQQRKTAAFSSFVSLKATGLFFATNNRRKGILNVKQNTTELSKQARAVIQIAGALLLVLGVEAVSNGAQFTAWLALPTGGWLFGRSMGA